MIKHKLKLTSKAAHRSLGQGVKAIRRFYEIGERSLETHARIPYGDVEDRATRAQLYREMFVKARKFAKSYTRAELDRLCGQCETHPRAGISLIIRIMAAPKKNRAAFQKMALQGNWSRARIDGEIRARFGPQARARGEDGSCSNLKNMPWFNWYALRKAGPNSMG